MTRYLPARPAFTFLLVLACVLAAASHAAAAPTWVRIDSPHFIVISDDGEKAARGVAWQFEQVRAVLQRLWPWARFDTGRAFTIFAVKNENGVRGIVPQYWEQKGGIRPTSAFFGGPNSHYVVLRTDIDASRVDVNPYRSAYWSYVGIVLDTTFPRRAPAWFTRGLAEVMANTIVRASDLTIGQIVPWTLQRLQSGRLSLGDLMGAGSDSKYMRDEAWMQLFDASAWALVHYLMFGEQGANLARFNQAATAILRGGNPDQAVADAFGGLPAVSLAYNKYSSSPAFAYRKINVDIDVDRDGFKARVLTPAEAAATRGAALAAQGRTADATALLTEARATEPGLGAAFELEGLLADRAGDNAAARAAYEKADAAGGTSDYARSRLARMRWPGAGVNMGALLPGPATPQAPRDSLLSTAVANVDQQNVLTRQCLAGDVAACGKVGPLLDWACDSGDLEKCYLVGLLYERGRGTARDSARAASRYDKACAGGLDAACLAGAMLQWLGTGVPKDPDAATARFSALCAKGIEQACAQYAAAVLTRPTPETKARAREVLDARCKAGMAKACDLLAGMAK